MGIYYRIPSLRKKDGMYLQTSLICVPNDLSRDSPSSNQLQWKTVHWISTSRRGVLLKFAQHITRSGDARDSLTWKFNHVGYTVKEERWNRSLLWRTLWWNFLISHTVSRKRVQRKWLKLGLHSFFGSFISPFAVEIKCIICGFIVTYIFLQRNIFIIIVFHWNVGFVLHNCIL